MNDLEGIRQDIASFADDESEVVVQPDGRVLFSKNGQDIECRVRESEDGSILVEVDGTSVPYKTYLSRQLGRLDIMAQRIILKRPPPAVFVDGPAHLDRISSNPVDGSAIDLLNNACIDTSPFSTRVLFVTADAGHGKTILLRKYEADQARRFLDGTSQFLFWHVDLQGRQLLRLSEALMGDLGELRVAGLWMSSIITLLHKRSLVIGIDGFDELAAEQGTTDALGALALLVNQMRSKGVLVAASRRTFFDTDDYLKRNKILSQGVVSQCEFDQLRLHDWTQKEAINYLRSIEVSEEKFIAPEKVYDDILEELDGNDHHPMVTRPFLLTYIAKALLLYKSSPKEFIGPMQNPMEGVASVVNEFIKREVEQKWKDHTTGEAYLDCMQHVDLLAAIAEEMWTFQKNQLPVETIEILASALMDEWSIPSDRRRQTIDMIKMHALLAAPDAGPSDLRGFDHPEFRDYFLAQSLGKHLHCGASMVPSGIVQLLSVAQLPDSVARFAAGIYSSGAHEIAAVLRMLSTLVKEEWRPTFLQANIGTIAPYLLSKSDGSTRIEFDAKVIYSSLVFEGLSIKNVEFSRGTLLHASLMRVSWSEVTFRNCEVVEMIFDRNAAYDRVEFADCNIRGIKIVDGENILAHEYAPERIVAAILGLGISVSPSIEFPGTAAASDETAPGQHNQVAHRILGFFRRTNGINEALLRAKLNVETAAMASEVIPIMESSGILKKVPWRGKGTPQNRWVLTRSLNEILEAEGGPVSSELSKFWAVINDKCD